MDIDVPKTDYEALVLALKLAVQAPTADEHRECIRTASTLASRLTKADLTQAMKEAEARLDADGYACDSDYEDMTEGEHIAELFEEMNKIVEHRGLTTEEKDLLAQGFGALSMFQLVTGKGRFFEIACDRLGEILPHLIAHQERRLRTEQKLAKKRSRAKKSNPGKGKRS